MSLQPGDIIEGKYRIVRLLGEGGMGAVYEGINTRIHRKVAIKLLHAAVAAKADVVQRFEKEAQAAGRIGSEHIVEVLDLGNLPSGERFMVMEYLEGESLGDRIKRRKRIPPHEMAQILHQMLEGLSAAHAAGIIHRDLKPDNIYLLSNKAGQKDFVKVLDFGVSKFNALDNDMSMTKTGAVMGTPFYMAPEQARGGKIDIRSDLYSVGVVVYQAVTGRVPFHAETFNELVFKIALESPEPAELVAPGLDPGFAALISRAMTRDAAGRFQTAKEFQAAVGHWLMTAPPDANFDVGGRASFPMYMPSSPTNPGMNTGGLGASTNPGGAPLAQSSGGLGASGSNPLVQSGAQLGASQTGTGLTMTSPQPRGSGAMIAIALVGILVVGGGGFFAYRTFAAKSAQPVVAASTTTAAPSAPTPPVTAAVTAPTPPTAATTATTAPAQTAVASAETATPSAVPSAPKLGGPWPPKGKTAPSSTATAKAPPPPGNPGGRTIGSDL